MVIYGENGTSRSTLISEVSWEGVSKHLKGSYVLTKKLNVRERLLLLINDVYTLPFSTGKKEVSLNYV